MFRGLIISIGIVILKLSPDIYTVDLIYSELYLRNMPKRKTSITIEQDMWVSWIKFVVDRTGHTRKLSEEVEKALEEYMRNHPPEVKSLLK
jgi:hypothetical protein